MFRTVNAGEKSGRSGLNESRNIALNYIITALIVLLSTSAISQERSLLNEITAADLVSSSSGVSIFRYSAFGLGAYPYRNSMPGTDLDVRFDGVPLQSISPFGVDLDLLTASLVDSLVISGNRVDITSVDPIDGKTQTDISFLQGIRHRFIFDTLYKKQISDTSGVVFSGSSSGMHRDEYTEKSGHRSYFLKYSRNFEKGSMFVNFRGWRDRDGLFNAFKDERMGERKTDTLTLSSGLRSFCLSERTRLDADVYYRDSRSRFDRYGSRRSLDDNEYGTRMTLSTARGRSLYGLEMIYDGVAIDSRIHDRTFNRAKYSLESFAKWGTERSKIAVRAAFRDHTIYDAGWFASVDGSFAATPKFRLMSGFEHGVAYHDAGREIYSTLIFCENDDTNPMLDYKMYSVYVGAKMNADILNASASIHQSKYAGPVFKPTTARITSGTRCPGNRLVNAKDTSDPMMVFNFGLSTSREAFSGFGMIVDGFVRIDSVIGEWGTWPSPKSVIRAAVDSRHSVYHDLIDLSFYGEGKALSWDEYVSNIDGTDYFLDCGMGLGVGKLELFYRIENVTDNTPKWFDTLSWLERNTMWGATWRFID